MSRDHAIKWTASHELRPHHSTGDRVTRAEITAQEIRLRHQKRERVTGYETASHDLNPRQVDRDRELNVMAREEKENVGRSEGVSRAAVRSWILMLTVRHQLMTFIYGPIPQWGD